jgi:hypothetical protein
MTWYVARAGQQSGPLSREQLQQMAVAGQLGPDAWIAGPEVSGWVPAAQLFPPPAPAWQPPAMQPQAMQQQLGVHQNVSAQQAFPLGVPGQQAFPQQAFPQQGFAPGVAPGQPKGDWVKERLRGLGAIGIAVLLVIFNVVTIATMGRFFPKTLVVGLGALGYGGWVVIFGDEYDDHTMQLVAWKRAGMYICGGLGAVLGLVLSIVIAE